MANSPDIQQIVARVRSVVGGNAALLHQPSFGGNESRYVQQCIDTGWVSSAGSFVTQLEQQICNFTDARHAIAVVNGTAARAGAVAAGAAAFLGAGLALGAAFRRNGRPAAPRRAR